MNILLLGAQGQLGWELGASLSTLGSVIHYGRSEADFTNLEKLEELVRLTKPRVIINAAAHTKVDQAETEPLVAHLINAKAPALLAKLARELSAWLIHYSTDYVFDGLKNDPYTEEDIPTPLNVYGHNKLDGDKAILVSGCRHLIFRTSWVFSFQSCNFAKNILELAKKETSFSVVADQYGSPTGVELLSSATALALHQALHSEKDLSGLYNLVAAGETNWHGYALYLIRRALEIGWVLAASPERIYPQESSKIQPPQIAQRPANSRLNTAKFTSVFGLTPPPWQYYVDRVLWSWSRFRNIEMSPPAPPNKIIDLKFIPPLNYQPIHR